MSIETSDPNLSVESIGPVAAASAVPAQAPPAGSEPVGMPLEARRRIGRNLRLLYAEVLNQPLPDRFDALLTELAARGETRGSS
ncbi:NepR family anti-sigma factor [Methylobacterium goesingense]|uniref:Anti-sigma factor NepR domain-containing protein n=1 Tax=Methylobacterium goesingense TaxID=243690 RepID=A0ABV2L5S7_9HYPH|nr:NepR family anti-sigma factor [Methylobacterium goesingense]GJD74784.1 hypothetical protein CFIICLFH_3020 [Methylobacterium goesingense]